MPLHRTAALTALAVLSAGCDASESYYSDSAGYAAEDAGVAQAGAQDFGYFRDILEAGLLPGPETLDDVGFFNEHYIDLPAADCGDSVCIHGRLGMMGNMINGGDCTIIMMGMNTPVDPTELEREPLDLVLAIDSSGSMDGDAMRHVKAGLTLMLEGLEPDDRVSLIDFDAEARLVAQGTGDDTDALYTAIADMSADGSTNIFDALELAYDIAEGNLAQDAELEIARDSRVLLLSDGQATAGVTDPEMITALATARDPADVLLTTIGLGSDFDIDLMQSLAEAGGGSFYYLEDTAAVEEVFLEEVTSFLVPLAHDAEIDVSVASGWEVREVYGTKDYTFTDDRAVITIDTLQIAGRTSHDDNDSGRRGGNGAMIVELVPSGASEGAVGDIAFDYLDAMQDLAPVTTEVAISSPFDPERMEDGEQFFEDASVEKAFVMLNIYAGFNLAAVAVEDWRLDDALTTLVALCGSVERWVEDNPDEDILDDLRYIRMFIDNLRAAGAGQQGEAGDPWPND